MLKSLVRKISLRFEGTHQPRTVKWKEAWNYFDNRRPVFDELIEALERDIPKNGVVFDIGANIGYFSKTLLDHINFEGNVYLFEPVPNLAKLCEQTFQNSPYTAHVHNCGLGDKDEQMDFYTDTGGNIGWNTLIAERARANMEKVQVSIKTFGSTGVDATPNLIKIDVEGAEYKVIEGLLPVMANWKTLPTIICEVGWGRNHPHWDKEVAAFEKLKALGYQYCNLQRESIELDSIGDTSDMLFIPPKRD